MSTEGTVRTAARALIIESDAVLVVEYRDAQGPWYLLPGGGQRHEETLMACVRREVREELEVDIEVGRLRYVREFLSSDHPDSHLGAGFHQLEVVFEARLAAGSRPRMPASPDPLQCGVRWLPIETLMEQRLHPLALRTHLVENRSEVAYLGATL